MGKLEFWAGIFASAAMTVAPMLFSDLALWARWTLFFVGVVGFLLCVGLGFAQFLRRRRVPIVIRNNTATNCGGFAKIEGAAHVIAEDNMATNTPTMFDLKNVGRAELRRNSHSAGEPNRPDQEPPGSDREE